MQYMQKYIKIYNIKIYAKIYNIKIYAKICNSDVKYAIYAKIYKNI